MSSSDSVTLTSCLGFLQLRSSALCLLQCSAPRRSSPPAAIVVDINKFLMGLQWGRDRGRDQRERRRPRLDDDANRSVSSVEDDFLTASEHLGEDSEDDGVRNGEICRRRQRHLFLSLARSLTFFIFFF